MRKTFASIKKQAEQHVLAPAKSIAVQINKSLTVVVKAGSDIDAIRKKYEDHSNNFRNYSHSHKN